jgi:hypothetical protein
MLATGPSASCVTSRNGSATIIPNPTLLAKTNLIAIHHLQQQLDPATGNSV